MQNLSYFSQSKKRIFELFESINSDLQFWFKQEPELWEAKSGFQEKSVKNYFEEISSLNQNIIQVLFKTQQEIYQGKFNNPYDYFESDFGMVDVILRIYFEFSSKTVHIQKETEIQDLKQVLILQMQRLFEETERFPEDFATNVKNSPGVITTVKLDYYQLIYLALSHAHQKLIDLQLNKSIKDSLKKKLRSKNTA